MSETNDEVPQGRLYQQVAAELERSIRLGIYPVGSRMPAERELSETLGVSRPTIREAVIALEIRGLVQSRHGAGVFVTGTTPFAPSVTAEFDIGPFELTEARRLFEGEAAALAAGTISDSELDELETLLGHIADKRNDQVVRERADRAFHLAIARATKNSAIVSVVQSLWDQRYQSPLCVYIFGRAREAGIQPPVDEHREILDALRRRDADAARAAMRAHLARVTESLFIATEHDEVERARLKVDQRRYDFARRAGVTL